MAPDQETELTRRQKALARALPGVSNQKFGQPVDDEFMERAMEIRKARLAKRQARSAIGSVEIPIDSLGILMDSLRNSNKFLRNSNGFLKEFRRIL